MTDDETDDDNDRMNRADRLREMREGRRRGGSRDADTDEQSADADSASDESDDASAETGEADDSSETVDATEQEEPVVDDESAADDASDPDQPTADDVQSGTDEEESGSADVTAEQADDSGSAVEESGFEFEESPAKAVAHDEKAEKTDVEAAEAAADEATADPQSGVAQTVSSTDAASAIEQLNGGGTFAIPDQATTVTEEEEGSTLDGAEQSVAAARAAAASRGTTHVGARTRVLEFELGSERFCLDIDYIEEIVELENMTRVPNSPSFVEGVVDLRGQVTTIINPKDALEVEKEGSGDLIIVFDSEEVGDQGHLGWVVDEVRQVTPVSDEEVNDSPDEEAEHINGIINREDEEDFVVWTTPELALNSS